MRCGCSSSAAVHRSQPGPAPRRRGSEPRSREGLPVRRLAGALRIRAEALLEGRSRAIPDLAIRSWEEIREGCPGRGPAPQTMGPDPLGVPRNPGVAHQDRELRPRAVRMGRDRPTKGRRTRGPCPTVG